MAARRLLFLFTTLTLAGAACRDQKVTAYRVPKEKDPELPGAVSPVTAPTANAPVMPGAAGGTNPNMAATPVVTATGADLVWDAPAAWKSKAASAMRKATYIVGDAGAEAELSITAFPNDVGGEAANINRWRGQVSLPPLAEAEMAGAVQRLTANDLAIAVVDFAGTGPNAQHLLGAIVPYQGATWFFKLLGPDATVAKAKPEFIAFLKTVKPAP